MSNFLINKGIKKWTKGAYFFNFYYYYYYFYNELRSPPCSHFRLLPYILVLYFLFMSMLLKNQFSFRYSNISVDNLNGSVFICYPCEPQFSSPPLLSCPINSWSPSHNSLISVPGQHFGHVHLRIGNVN